MNKLLLLILAFAGITLSSFSQSREGQFLVGQVVDEYDQAIPFANVVVYNSSDSSLAKGGTSNEEGRFSIPIEDGSYYINISFLSYENYINSELLDEVEITEKRSEMELKLDKRVFNIEKNLSNAGASAAEILDNIPSVQVDVEGNVSLRGSQNVRVLIDGKPSSITGSNTGDILRQFQGSMIDRVEVITNPSARYDAEGEVGIINIILKKEEQRGLNGSVEGVAGYPENFRASFNLNYRSKKTNFFTSYGGAYRKSPGYGKTYQTFDNGDTSYIYIADSDRERGGLSQNFRLGADYFFDQYNTLTVSGLYRYGDELNIATYEYRDLYSNNELYQLVTREDEETESDENIEGAISYVRKYAKKDQKFTVDLQWSESNDLEKSEIFEESTLNDNILEQKTSNLEANRTILIQSDYIYPIGEKGIFETGIRTTLRDVENDFSVIERDSAGGDFEILDRFNNNFHFDENIYAGYVMFGNEINSFSYQVGLRGEYSDVGTELKRTDETNSWEYFNLFPSAHLTYKLKSKDDFQLSYSRRINRPSYRYLMPFQTFSDVRNLWRGNPNLQPEYTDSYEFGYLKYFPKGSLFSSIYYRYRTGVIQRITIPDAQGFTIRIPVNAGIENNYGFEFNLSYDFTKKFNVNASVNLYRSILEGSFQDIELNNDVFTMSSRLLAKLEILPKVDFQFSGRYRAPQKTPQGESKSLYTIDLSLAKDIFKGKGTLVVSGRDILNSRVRRSIVYTGELYSESEFQWRARQFLVSLTYRINQNKKRGRGNGMRNADGGDDF